jgi:hypothetical protein
MSKRDQHKKLSDIYNESAFATGKKSFAEAFPEIEDITVEVKETGEGVSGNNSPIVLKKEQLGSAIDCHNPRCFGGGFPIGRVVRKMVLAHQTEDVIPRKCQGYEGSPQGRSKNRDCYNRFEVKIFIKYKE